MKEVLSKTIVAITLAILVMAASSATQVRGQQSVKEDGIGLAPETRKGARALEGSWTVQTTIRNCTTGAPFATFAKMVTFMQGGTAQEDSVGSAPLARTSAHGVWSYEGEHNFSYALQFFRFNADGTYGSLTRARWQVEMDETADSYSASATIQVFNPAGTQVATACATETALRFQ
ncbi:MAG: hypothetical protein H0U23_14120 [Blastocatellia bacterium]|nr:hypothetical protein [Blastocatellia bacterium]